MKNIEEELNDSLEFKHEGSIYTALYTATLTGYKVDYPQSLNSPGYPSETTWSINNLEIDAVIDDETGEILNSIVLLNIATEAAAEYLKGEYNID